MRLVQPLGNASLATTGSFFLLDRVSFETSMYLLAEKRSSEVQSKFLPHGIGHLLPQGGFRPGVIEGSSDNNKQR
jgi:hypothetical protein